MHVLKQLICNKIENFIVKSTQNVLNLYFIKNGHLQLDGHWKNILLTILFLIRLKQEFKLLLGFFFQFGLFSHIS